MGSSGSTMHQPGSVFPLATIVLVLIFFLVGTLSCFFNRRRQRFLRRSLHPSVDNGGDAHGSAGIPPTKIAPFEQDLEQGMLASVAVIMPGKEIPTYMAWSRPCQASSLPPPTQSPAIKFDATDVPKSPPQDRAPVVPAPSLVHLNPLTYI